MHAWLMWAGSQGIHVRMYYYFPLFFSNNIYLSLEVIFAFLNSIDLGLWVLQHTSSCFQFTLHACSLSSWYPSHSLQPSDLYLLIHFLRYCLWSAGQRCNHADIWEHPHISWCWPLLAGLYMYRGMECRDSMLYRHEIIHLAVEIKIYVYKKRGIFLCAFSYTPACIPSIILLPRCPVSSLITSTVALTLYHKYCLA